MTRRFERGAGAAETGGGAGTKREGATRAACEAPAAAVK